MPYLALIEFTLSHCTTDLLLQIYLSPMLQSGDAHLFSFMFHTQCRVPMSPNVLKKITFHHELFSLQPRAVLPHFYCSLLPFLQFPFTLHFLREATNSPPAAGLSGQSMWSPWALCGTFSWHISTLFQLWFSILCSLKAGTTPKLLL